MTRRTRIKIIISHDNKNNTKRKQIRRGAKQGKTRRRRRVFWGVIVKLVNAGHTSDSTVDEVYNCYGRSLPVSIILRKMVHDRKAGGNPNLQIYIYIYIYFPSIN